ncbi:MAG: hypothetical protein CMJ18_26745 [Phycisphaeraceae bacterium]|nr:hypothetical protein [Phycisphaeraceae bacterium]
MSDNPDTVFDETGVYWLKLDPGEHVIRELVPDGYEQTFPDPSTGGAHVVDLAPGERVRANFGNEPQPGSVHGLKWFDRNGNGQRDAGEPGVPGVTIYADLDHDGALDANEPSTLTMLDDPNTPVNETGMYWLGLEPGDYVIREVLPSGHVQTFPRRFNDIDLTALSADYDISLLEGIDPSSGNLVSSVDIADHAFVEIAPRAIELTLGLGETATEQVSMTVHPFCIVPIQATVIASPAGSPAQNLSGVQINGCGGDVSTWDIQFAGDGNPHEFELLVVDVGPFAAAERPTVLGVVPVSISVPGGAGAGHRVTIAPGGVVEDKDFGNRPLPSSVHGIKWSDENGDGQRSTSEPGLGGVTVYADENNNGAFDAGEPSAVTMSDNPNTVIDEAGVYWLRLEPGQHVIREGVPQGYRQTFPDPSTGGAHLVDLAPGERGRANFGNLPLPGSIHGRKWLDMDGDGHHDPHEPGRAGVVIYLDLNGNGALDNEEPHVITIDDDPVTDFDETGLYSFVDVEPGDYLVREILQPGFIQTFPADGGPHVVNVAPGQGVNDVNFGNRQFTIAGDLTLDWKVGSDDLQIVLRHFTRQVPPGTLSMGDATGPHGLPDGVVGSADLQVVLANFTRVVVPPPPITIPGASAQATSAASSASAAQWLNGQLRSRPTPTLLQRLALFQDSGSDDYLPTTSAVADGMERLI